MSGTGWRPALRIARRDVLRSKGRSALVAAMVALPVIAVTALVVLTRTSDITPVEALPTELGTADALVQPAGHHPVKQRPLLDYGADTSGGASWSRAQVDAALPPGSRLVPLTRGATTYATDLGYATALGIQVDLRDPLAHGLATVVSGRAPAAADEVLVTPDIAGQGHRVGTSIRVGEDRAPMRVVGVVDVPRDGDRVLVALPGSRLALSGGPHHWLADTPGPVSWQQVRDLNKQGLYVLSRAVVLDPPPQSQVAADMPMQDGDNDAATYAVVALVVAMVVLEVVLLAGPAFAVGVRRRRRELALLAATGGDARHVRRVVLAGGLVLGGGAAVAGAVLGVGAAWLAQGPVERLGASLGPFDVPWGQVALTVVVGAASGLAAAYVPARQAARQDVVAALHGRRGAVRTRPGWPIVGAVAVALGLAATWMGAAQENAWLIVLGTVGIVLGLVAATSWLVGQAARLAGRLPLPLRLATRDAGRNRGRTAPAVAAIMASVAGITALAIGSASDFRQGQLDYTPRAPIGTSTLQVSERSPKLRAAVLSTVRSDLPDARLQAVGGFARYRDGCAGCPRLELARPHGMAPGYVVATFDYILVGGPEYILVGGPEVLRRLAPDAGPAAARALASGTAVALDPTLVRHGTIAFRTYRVDESGDERPHTRQTVRVPAVAAGVPAGRPLHALVIVPRRVAERRFDVPVATIGWLVSGPDGVSAATEERIGDTLSRITPEASFYVERGPRDTYTLVFVLLALAGAVLVLGGTLVATALALADARPDLATLAAVGASPRTRRLLAMGQAAFIAAFGVGLGVLAGAAPGIAITWPLTAPGWSGPGSHHDAGPVIDIPWSLLGIVCLAVPLVAVLATGLATRSRLPLVRRIE